MYQVFLKLAIEDLRAAEYLLDGKFFPQSVFYLEQSVEKAVKSLGLWLKVITEEEARTKIGHNAWKIYFKMYDYVMERARWFKKLLERYPQLREIEWIRGMEKYSDRLMNEADRLRLDELKTLLSKPKRDEELKKWLHDARMLAQSEGQLQEILAELDKLNNLIETLRKVIENIKLNEEDIKRIREDFRSFLRLLVPAISTQYQPFAEKFEEALKLLDEEGFFTVENVNNLLRLYGEFISKYLFCLLSLFCLSSVFVPHVTTSRYPGEYPGETNPLEAYSENTPVIRMMGRSIDQTKKVLETLDELYRMEEQIRLLTSLL